MVWILEAKAFFYDEENLEGITKTKQFLTYEDLISFLKTINSKDIEELLTLKIVYVGKQPFMVSKEIINKALSHFE